MADTTDLKSVARKGVRVRLPPQAPHLERTHMDCMTLTEAINRCEDRPAAYVLRSADGTYLYKGACRNMARRMCDHRAGRVSRTKNRRPLTLVYFEYMPDFRAARQRENYLKSGTGRAFLQSILG